ncbi:hypothetical protein JOM56_007995 [Amanita muscaria]
MACLVDILKIVEELHLIRCSLLPTETLHFIDQIYAQSWTRILDEYATAMTISDLSASYTVPPTFQIRFNSPGSLADVWLEVEMSKSGPGKPAMASFRGSGFTRADQGRWQELKLQKEGEVAGADYPTYELLSTHLLPLLHEHFESGTTVNDQEQQSNDDTDMASTGELEPEIYHTLLTSHHLVSITKRRSLQEWSSSLSISGFAKVGYPGVIYAEGKRDDVEEFVANVKAMQWLALRVRFVEPLLEEPEGIGRGKENAKGRRKGWKEFQKVGEVVQEMKRLGRERYVVEMGIGSGRGQSK